MIIITINLFYYRNKKPIVHRFVYPVGVCLILILIGNDIWPCVSPVYGVDGHVGNLSVQGLALLPSVQASNTAICEPKDDK